MKKKGRWKKLLVLVIVLAAVGGGSVYGVRYLLKRNSTAVDVIAVSQVDRSEWVDWDSDQGDSYGTVTSDMNQEISPSDDQVIEEVFVDVGSEVKVGDKLLKYDTTLLQLDQELQDLNVQSLKLELESAEADLVKLKNTTPVVKSGGSTNTGTGSDPIDIDSDDDADDSDDSDDNDADDSDDDLAMQAVERKVVMSGQEEEFFLEETEAEDDTEAPASEEVITAEEEQFSAETVTEQQESEEEELILNEETPGTMTDPNTGEQTPSDDATAVIADPNQVKEASSEVKEGEEAAPLHNQSLTGLLAGMTLAEKTENEERHLLADSREQEGEEPKTAQIGSRVYLKLHFKENAEEQFVQRNTYALTIHGITLEESLSGTIVYETDDETDEEKKEIGGFTLTQNEHSTAEDGVVTLTMAFHDGLSEAQQQGLLTKITLETALKSEELTSEEVSIHTSEQREDDITIKLKKQSEEPETESETAVSESETAASESETAASESEILIGESELTEDVQVQSAGDQADSQEIIQENENPQDPSAVTAEPTPEATAEAGSEAASEVTGAGETPAVSGEENPSGSEDVQGQNAEAGNEEPVVSNSESEVGDEPQSEDPQTFETEDTEAPEVSETEETEAPTENPADAPATDAIDIVIEWNHGTNDFLKRPKSANIYFYQKSEPDKAPYTIYMTADRAGTDTGSASFSEGETEITSETVSSEVVPEQETDIGVSPQGTIEEEPDTSTETWKKIGIAWEAEYGKDAYTVAVVEQNYIPTISWEENVLTIKMNYLEPQDSPLSRLEALAQLDFFSGYDGKYYKGSGTAEDPYIFFVTDGVIIRSGFVNWVLGFNEEGTQRISDGYHVRLEIRESDTITGAFIRSVSLDGTIRMDHGYGPGTYWIFSSDTGIVRYEENVPDPPNENPDDPDNPDNPDNPDDPGWDDNGDGYTAEELAAAIKAKEREIRELKVDIKEAELKLRKYNRQMEESTVLSIVNGYVKSIGTSDDSDAYMVISSTSGMYLKCSVGELDLDQVYNGMEISCASAYDSGVRFTAKVTSVSYFPSSNNLDNYWGGSTNKNSSSYPVTAVIEEESSVSEDDVVTVTFQKKQSGSKNVYLPKAYIRTENGQSYVYLADENGKLYRQYVRTGATSYGYVEIREGVRATDNIAFPYGKNVKNGADTKVSEDGDFYY
ncbi:MAG: hypothetical protein Q4B01_02155 [Eubacteriales bacterium]|nr:hypothetical protein [Eubacteriales bacterium]